MTPQEIEKIVEQARTEWNYGACKDPKVMPYQWIPSRAAQLAAEKEREATATMLRLLIDAPHQEHFATRLNDEEMKGIDTMKKWLDAYKRDKAARAEAGRGRG